MPVSDFKYTPIPEERRVEDDYVSETVAIPKWAQYAVNDFGTKEVACEDRENWGVILKTFGIAMAMLIIIIVVLLIGLIYLCLRCKGYLNPIKEYAERRNQRCVRCILTLLMLLLLAGILYFVIMAIKNSSAKRHVQEQKSSTRSFRGLDHVFGLNFEEFQRQVGDSANDIVRNWSAATPPVDDAPKTLCPPEDLIMDLNNRVADVNDEFELLCLGILEWSDYMRFFHRNMTSFMSETKPGRKLIRELDFRNFLSRTLHVEKLLDFYRNFSIVAKFFDSFTKLYNATMNWPVNLKSSTKNALSPYFLEIKKDLDDKGSQFQTLSTKLSNERGVDDNSDYEDYDRLAHAKSDEDTSKEPTGIFVLDIICYTLLLLITVILLIALLLRCCGKRYRREAKCCNQENGSCLFQLAAFLMFLFLLLVLYPFLWHFVHGAGRYNGDCKRNAQNTDQNERSVDFYGRRCLNEATFKRKLNDYVDRKIDLKLPDNSTDEDVNLSTPVLQKYAITFKQSARTAKKLNLPHMCEEITNSTDPMHLTAIYTAIYKYANTDIPDKSDKLKELSLCNLQSFKTRRIDEYETSDVFISATRIATYCDRIVEFFNENHVKMTGECLNGIESLKNNFSKQNKPKLSEVIAGLNEMYTKELDGYVNMATNRLVNEVGLCRSDWDESEQTMSCDKSIHLQNVSWSALLILIWLVLPLIPIALYLARLYGMCSCRCVQRDSRSSRSSRNSRSSRSSRSSRCSRGAATTVRTRSNDRWNTNTLMDEMQKHLYKSFCENSPRTGATNGQSCCNAERSGRVQGANRGKRCLDDGSANFAMRQQANALLLKGKGHTKIAPRSPKLGQVKENKEHQTPTTSKGRSSIQLKQLSKVNQIEKSSFKKCDCNKSGPSSSMSRRASSRPRKEMKNVCETLEEIVEEVADDGKNGLKIKASIHVLSFKKK